MHHLCIDVMYDASLRPVTKPFIFLATPLLETNYIHAQVM